MKQATTTLNGFCKGSDAAEVLVQSVNEVVFENATELAGCLDERGSAITHVLVRGVQ